MSYKEKLGNIKKINRVNKNIKVNKYYWDKFKRLQYNLLIFLKNLFKTANLNQISFSL